MAEAQVRLNVDTRGAVTGLRKAQLETQKLEKQVNRTSKATASATANIQRFGIAFRSVVGPVVAVTGAVTLLSRSLKVMSDREADIAVLRNGLQGLTTDVGQAVSDLQKAADALGKATLFDEEDFNKGFKLLTSFRTIGVESYERVAKAAADVAQVSGSDVSSAFMQLAKAIDMPERNLSALTRSGILFTKEQSKQIIELKKAGKTLEAQSKLLEVIEGQYNGAAIAAGDTFAGAVDTLGENFRDFQERLGKGVAPALTQVVKGMTKLLEVTQKIPAPVGQAALAVGTLAAAIAALKAAAASTAVVGLIQSLATLSGVTTATAVGFNAAGAATFAYTTKVSAATVSLGLLKAALVALPWVGVAAGVTFFVSKIIEANTKQKELNETIKSGGREALEAALNTSILAHAQAQQRIENLKAQRRVTGAAMRSAKEDLELQNDNIRKIRDRLGILAEESEKKQESVDLSEKAKDISKKQYDLENQLREAKVRGNAQEIAYVEKLLEREKIMQRDMQARQRMNALLQTEFDYSEKIKALRQEIADAFTGAAVKPGQFGGEFGGIFENGGERTQHLEELKKKLKELQSPMLAIKNISGGIADAFSISIAGMVNGTMTAKQALANFFQSVSQSFLNMATDIIKAAIRMMAFKIISSLFPGVGAAFGASNMVAPGLSGSGALGGNMPSLGIGGSLGGANYSGGGLAQGIGGSISGATFGGFKARGGRVSGGRGYIVGENGPEYFRPGIGGKIYPNNKLPKMVDLGGKFMPMHPLFMAAMFGIGNFGGNRQAVMEGFGARFGHAIPRANGGPVSPASNYMVGEKGPEVFVPRGGGGGGGAMVVVNVDAKGTQAEGSEPNANKLGEAIGMAVRQELVRQKRPGGLLA